MTGSSIRPPEASVLTGFRSRDPNFWLEATSWGVIVLCALQISTFSFGRDQSIYAVVGDGILNGRMPYRDLWDFKPPGIFLVHALGQALFGKHMFSARLLEVVALLGGVMCLRSISQQFFENRTVGLVGGAVGALIHAQLDFWHSGQPETFGVAFTWLALWLTLRESGKRVHWVALGVGLAFGAAALMKPPLGGGAIVAAAYLAQRARSQERGIRRALLLAGLVGAGAALPTLASLLWFWARGAYAEMYWTLGEFTPGYTALSWEGRRAADMLYHAIEEAFFKFSALSAAGVVAAVAMRPLFTRERELLFVLLGVIAIQVAGIAMQGKFFAYHYAATLSLIAAIAGIGLYKLWLRCLQGGVGGIIAFCAFIVVAVPMRYAVRDLPQFFWERCAIRLEFLMHVAPYDSREAMDEELSYVADYNLASDRRVAREVAHRTGSNDSVYVWGFEPAIYWLSERRPASRYIYNVAQRSTWESEYARRGLMTDLWKTPPKVIVVQARDVFPSVTGTNTDSRDELPSFPELHALVTTEYELVTRVDFFDVYQRRTAGAPVEPAAPAAPPTPAVPDPREPQSSPP
jgi:hypothetical protein